MALAIFGAGRRARKLDLREQTIRQQEAMAAFERVAGTIPFTQEPFTGLGDSAAARQLLEAMQGALSTANRVIKERIAGLRMGAFQRRFVDGDFEDVPAFDHPLQRLLDNPTRDPDDKSITHSAGQLFGSVISNYHAIGEAYHIVRHDGSDMPIGLQMAQPGTIEPRVRGGRIAGYQLVTIGAGQSGEMLRPVDVVRYWNPDEYELFTPRGTVARNLPNVNMDAFAAKTWEKFYQFDATPKTAIETQNLEANAPTKDQKESFFTNWTRNFNRRRGERQGTPQFITPGWSIKTLDSGQEAASGVTMMEFTRQVMFESLGVSTSMVGRNQDVNRAAAETARFTFDQNAVEPKTRMIAEALTLQVASQYPGQSDRVQLIVKYLPFLARDKEFELRKDQADLAAFVRSVDEVREQREPALQTPAGWGALPLGPFGIQPITGDVDTPDLSGIGLDEGTQEVAAAVEVTDETEEPETPEEEERSRAYRKRGLRLRTDFSLRNVRAHFAPALEWERTVQRDNTHTPRFQSLQNAVFDRQTQITIERFVEFSNAERGERQTTPEELTNIIFPLDGWDDLFRVFVPVRGKGFRDSANAATQPITGRDYSMTRTARKLLQDQNTVHKINTNDTTQKSILKVLDRSLAEGMGTQETARRIATDAFRDRKRNSLAIARTEMGTAMQEAQVLGFLQTGVVEGKQWNNSLDGRVRDSHLIEGQVRELSESFQLDNGESASAPLDASLSAGARINCRCFVTPTFLDDLEGSALG